MLKTSAGLLLAIGMPAHAQWVPQTSGTDAEFRGLSVVSPNVVWASGTRGRFARTTNGGTTWVVDSVATASGLDFRAVHARNATVAWVMSAGEAERGQAKIFKTNDTGRTWALQYSTRDSGVFLDAIAFWDDRHGIAMSDPVNGKLVLLVTGDGGTTWTRVPPEALPPMLKGEAAFAASGTCITVQGDSAVFVATGGAERARVFRSSNRGRTWTVSDTPLHSGGSAGIFSVAFADARRGVVVGGDYAKPNERFDNVALTADGGRTWRLAKGPLPAGYMSAVAVLPGTRGQQLVAVGLAGTATSSDGGESWTMVDSTAYNSVAFATAGEGWAVGPKGRIAKWKP
jgi:photosystem II stability/assembly factor-like uncharacterized protein